MDKEEILRASRHENQNKDFFELETIGKGQRIGGLAAVSIAFVLITAERLTERGMNYGYFLIVVSMAAVLCLYKAIKLKRKLDFLLAALFGIADIYAAIMVIMSYIG